MKRLNRAALQGELSRLPQMTEEDKAQIALRCLQGESEASLARELGTTPKVVESWVERVGEVVKDEQDEISARNDLELQAKINDTKSEYERLQKQIEATRRQIEIREMEIKLHEQARPMFMKGN